MIVKYEPTKIFYLINCNKENYLFKTFKKITWASTKPVYMLRFCRRLTRSGGILVFHFLVPFSADSHKTNLKFQLLHNVFQLLNFEECRQLYFANSMNLSILQLFIAFMISNWIKGIFIENPQWVAVCKRLLLPLIICS